MKSVFAYISYMSVFVAIVALISLIISVLDILFYLNSPQLTRIGIASVFTICLIKQKILYIGYGPWQ